MRHLMCGLALAGLAGAASAQDFTFGGGLTTFGPAIEGAYGLGNSIHLRGVGYLPISLGFDDIEVDDYTLDGEAETGALALLVDWYPRGSGWRLSGGVFLARDEIVSGTFSGPETFEGALSMERSVAPMVTGGYRFDFPTRWYVSGEIGAIISGFEATTNSTDPTVLSEIDAINADLDDLPAYPYLSLMVGFSF